MSLVAIVARDLITATRISEAALAAGHEVRRVDRPQDLPAASRSGLVFVDWGAREDGWGHILAGWRATAGAAPVRLILFGPHTDLAAHAAARDAGIGPVVARSKLINSLAEWMRALDG